MDLSSSKSDDNHSNTTERDGDNAATPTNDDNHSNTTERDSANAATPTNIDVGPVTVTASTPQERKLLNVGRWVLFSLIFASLPIILATLSLILHGIPVTIDNTLAHGELLLVSTAILGEVTGDLLFSNTVSRRFRIIVTGANLFFLILTIYFFADAVRTSTVANMLASFKNNQIIEQSYYINNGIFALYSFFIFFYTIIIGLACKIKVID